MKVGDLVIYTNFIPDGGPRVGSIGKVMAVHSEPRIGVDWAGFTSGHSGGGLTKSRPGHCWNVNIDCVKLVKINDWKSKKKWADDQC